MLFRKFVDCFSYCLCHISYHDLLSLLLNEVLAVVLAFMRVYARRETHNRVLSRVAHVKTQQHHSILLYCIREAHSVQVTANFGIHLPQNIGSFGDREALRILESDTLR